MIGFPTDIWTRSLSKAEHETVLANGLFHLSYVEGLRAFAGHSWFYSVIVGFKINHLANIACPAKIKICSVN